MEDFEIKDSVYVDELTASLEETMFCIDEIFSHSDSREAGEQAVINTILKSINKNIDSANVKINRITNYIDFISKFKSIATYNNYRPKGYSMNINELIDEPINIPETPILEREQEIKDRHIQAVLDVLKDKYSISLSLDGKEADDILNLYLESDLDITPIDIKLFIPSMFLNHINSIREYHPSASSAGVLFQEDYITIESIANNPKSKLKQLVELYALIDNRRKPHALLNEVIDKAKKSDNADNSNNHKEL